MRNTTTIGSTMINVKGIAVHVAVEQGDDNGPPLLLINGIGANLELLDPFLEALDTVGGPTIGTIRFDVPGIGGSPLPRFPLRFRGLARLICGMLDVLGHPVVDVLGISSLLFSPEKYTCKQYLSDLRSRLQFDMIA